MIAHLLLILILMLLTDPLIILFQQHRPIPDSELGPSCREPDEADAEDEHAEGQQHSANIGEVD